VALNTTPFHGKVCRILKAGTNLEYNIDWNINVTLEISDGKRMGQEWKEGYPGWTEWSGSFQGSFVPGNTEQKAFFDDILDSAFSVFTDVQFILDDVTNWLAGSFHINHLSVTVNTDEVVKFKIDFKGGAVNAPILIKSWGTWCTCSGSGTGGGHTPCGSDYFDLIKGIHRYVGYFDTTRGAASLVCNCLTNCGVGEDHTITPAELGGAGCLFKTITAYVYQG